MSIYRPKDVSVNTPLELPLEILRLSENFGFFGTAISTGRTWLPCQGGISFSRHPHDAGINWVRATFPSSLEHLALPLLNGAST